jgi:hypothetical protein
MNPTSKCTTSRAFTESDSGRKPVLRNTMGVMYHPSAVSSSDKQMSSVLYFMQITACETDTHTILRLGHQSGTCPSFSASSPTLLRNRMRHRPTRGPRRAFRRFGARWGCEKFTRFSDRLAQPDPPAPSPGASGGFGAQHGSGAKTADYRNDQLARPTN